MPTPSSSNLSSNQGHRHEPRLTVLICPGFHASSLTDAFVRSLPAFITPHVVQQFPADPFTTFQALKHTFERQPVVAIGFSAGVVGLVGALTIWQQQGGQIQRLFAMDGWGIPTIGLPVCRMSHDAFTHWSSVPLGMGNVNFYAEPSVEHLQMWANPAHVKGWQIGAPSLSTTSLLSTTSSKQLSQKSAANNHPANNRAAISAQLFLHAQLQHCYHELCP